MPFELPRRLLPAEKIRHGNSKILSLMSDYLNLIPRAVTAEDIKAITGCGVGVSEEFAFAEILAAVLGLESDGRDRDFYRNYFPPMVHLLDTAGFREDPYYRLLAPKKELPTGGKWELRRMTLSPYEGFVCGDLLVTPDRRLIPQIGFFAESYTYPAILENGREWMTLLPNETITTLPAVAEARGKVLTYGLGLGYFAYMTARKPEVSSVTVVERSAEAISLFRAEILPLWEPAYRAKLRIMEADAFVYAAEAMPGEGYDFVFADIWHDVGDGRALYLRMKEFEKYCPAAVFRYWLEDTIQCYLDAELWEGGQVIREGSASL